MSKALRTAIVFTLVLTVVAGGLLAAGCSKGQAKLELPTVELYQYLKGTTGDLNDATLNQIAEGGGEPGYKFGTMKYIYPTVFAANKDTVAAAVFGSPYKFGDGISTTTYAQLTAGDQLAVDGTIFATKLSAAEQDLVMNALTGFFNRQEVDTSAAKPMQQNTANGILMATDNTGVLANEWKTDATAWMAALNAKAAADYSGKTYVQLTYVQKETVKAAVFVAGTINPEYAFYQAMTKDSYRNGNASVIYSAYRDAIVAARYPGRTYATLNPILEAPVVDAMVWYQLTDAEKTPVNAQVAGTFAFAQSQPTDNTNVLYGILAGKVSAAAADGWKTDVLAGAKMEWAFYKWLVYESFRNGTAASFYPTQVAAKVTDAKTAGYITASTYAACNAYEKIVVNGMVWSVLGLGEQGYVLGLALPGLFGLVQAEMTDAVSLDQTICYLTLYGNVNATSAEGWKKDVAAGVNQRQAFYRWLAKEGVSAMGAAASLIQLGLQEFYFKVDNPNNYEISLDSLNINFTVKASTGETVTAAKQSLVEPVWVPAKQSVNLRVLAPVKTMDVITWQVLIGKSTSQAMTLAADVWGQIQAGTAKWAVAFEATISNKKETLTETYNL
jgi:hypothetical protein